jgi:DNA-binding PadR family transcriptional regulator
MGAPRRGPELTTTSFALLGLLATRPSGWSAYELTQQMRRSLHYVWPRAERNLYDEAKLLAQRGYARARDDGVGRRPRTVYTITRRGRAALRGWLEEPSAPLLVESEALVRVFFAELGSLADVQGAIRSLRDDAIATERDVAELVGSYDTDGGPFPERLHVIALMGNLLHTQRQALLAWCDWAEAEISTWTSTTLDDGARVPAGVFADIVAAAADAPG